MGGLVEVGEGAGVDASGGGEEAGRLLAVHFGSLE